MQVKALDNVRKYFSTFCKFVILFFFVCIIYFEELNKLPVDIELAEADKVTGHETDRLRGAGKYAVQQE